MDVSTINTQRGTYVKETRRKQSCASLFCVIKTSLIMKESEHSQRHQTTKIILLMLENLEFITDQHIFQVK